MWRCRTLARRVNAPSPRSPRPLVPRNPRLLLLMQSLRTSAGPGEHGTRRKLYLIAGEPSGDAIGSKVIAALERSRRRGDPRAQSLQIRGIGGPLMCEAGAFESLFPMRELSVMGLVELLPHVLRLRRRLGDTLSDIRAFRPDVVLTIDSKGFTFRVLKALQADPETRDTVTRMHYVAPSVWAYKHRRRKQDFADMGALLDAMFAILPFEEEIFNPRGNDPRPKWCHFVGHPAVEDFFEFHGAFSETRVGARAFDAGSLLHSDGFGPDALLDVAKYSVEELSARAKLVHSLLTAPSDARGARAAHGIAADAFVICALVGSRQHEVRKSMQLVIKAVEAFAAESLAGGGDKKVHVVFPTVATVEREVQEQLASAAPSFAWSVSCGLSVSERSEIFQARCSGWPCSDVAVAVSGTVVFETALANLPTVTIYRANRVTEWIAKRLAAVRFVSLPNLLLGKEIIPELLFRDCTAANITRAIRQLERSRRGDSSDLAVTVSTLARWKSSSGANQAGNDAVEVPVRASDAVAEHILRALEKQPL